MSHMICHDVHVHVHRSHYDRRAIIIFRLFFRKRIKEEKEKEIQREGEGERQKDSEREHACVTDLFLLTK